MVTVGELIEKLKKFPEDSEVRMDIDWSDAEIGDVEDCNGHVLLSMPHR